MDLFYGTTFEENIAAYKKDLRVIATSYNYDFGRRKIHIAYGQPEHIGKCILVVGPPIKEEKPFQDKYSQYLFQTATDFNLNNVILTSCFLIPIEQVSKADVKEFSPWIEKLVDIFQPRLIVALGEDAEFSFVRRKCILRDYHGQVIARSNNGTDVILSYPMSYYLERSRYEDPSYKEFIRKNDWKLIAKRYKDRP